jgi:chromosome partitioning protein
VERIRQNFNERLRVGGIFFTKYASTYRRALHRQYAGDLQEDQGLAGLVLTQTIRENIALAEAQSMQQPVYDYAPSSSGAADYAALTDEILRRLS